MKFLIPVLLLSSLFVSCKSRKKITESARPTVDSVVFVNQTNGKDSLLRQKWEHFSGRIAVDFQDDEQSQSGLINLRMRRDSIIWFSVNAAMGIQVLKGVVTKDSIRYLDLFNKKYYAYGISALGNQLGAEIGLHELQNLFIGNPVFDTMVYVPDPSRSNGWIAVSHPVSSEVFCNHFSYPDSTFLVQKGSNREMKALYSGTKSAGSFLVPSILDLTGYSASKTVRLKLEFKTASDAVIPSYPFTVPEGYEYVAPE